MCVTCLVCVYASVWKLIQLGRKNQTLCFTRFFIREHGPHGFWNRTCFGYSISIFLYKFHMPLSGSISIEAINNQIICFTRFLAATKQLYKWYFPSVRLSVCPSVCLSVTPFWLCSHHRIIMKFSGVITNDQCKVHAKGQGQRSKVKVTEVTTQLNRFRTVTPVWIHIWW